MKIIKIIDLILLLVVMVIGTIYEIYPSIIPEWLFTTMWIISPIALVVFGIILYVEKKQKNDI